MQSYIIHSLPRSRSFWLSKFLTYGNWYCSHDQLVHARSLDDVKTWLTLPNTGTVETLSAPWWRFVWNIKNVVIRRPVSEVVDSMERMGYPIDRASFTKHIEHLDRKLQQIEHRVPNVLSVAYKDLDSEETCKQIFEFCLPYQHDQQWWAATAALNLQDNMNHKIRYYAAYQEQLEKLGRIAKHTTISLMRPQTVDQDDGLSIQEEPFDRWYDDAKHLFDEHLIKVGESPGEYQKKNIGLMRDMAETGNLQITTARCNGKIFGYLMATIGPSLEDPTVVTAVHTTFYGSSLFPGLGMKLQRASVEGLRAKGITEVYLHAGVRGSAARNSLLYRRMGAESFGELYKLNL